MTLRYLTKQFVAYNTNMYGDFLNFYQFMTAPPPIGPGWTSVGEGNGTVGGMGVTGIITGPTSLNATNSWFVLQAPTGAKQILFRRYSSYGDCALYVNRLGDNTGGGPSTIPTGSNKIIFNNYSFQPSYDRYCNIVASDVEPYHFCLFSLNAAGTIYAGFGMFPIINGVTADVDPVAYYGSAAGYAFDMSSISNYNMTGSATNADISVVRAFSPDGSAHLTIPFNSYVNYTNRVVAAGGPSIPDNGMVGLPILCSTSNDVTPAVLKGWVDPTFIMVRMQSSANGVTWHSKQWINVGSILLKWDGVSEAI